MEAIEMATTTATVEKPGYKQTRFGPIPQDWELTTLKKCCAMIKDGTHFSPVSKDGPRKYITSKNIRKGYLDLTDVSFISEEEHRVIYSRCPVRKGDVLLTKDGASTGNVCLNSLDEEFSLLSSVAVIRADEGKASNAYLLQYLLSPIGERAIDDEIAGQAITRITLDKIQAIQLPLPPLDEQLAISEILGRLDKSIKLNTDLLAAKRTYKRGLMQQLLTGQRRFPEFQGQPLPLVAIGEMITESRELLPVSNPYERITVRLNLNGVEARDVRGTEAEDATVYYLRRAGQFIYGKQNLHKGAMGIIPVELDGYSSTQDMPTFGFADMVHPQWFLYLMSREDFYPTLEKIATGTGSKRIQPASLYKIEVPFPSLPEQQRIAAVLRACDQETELLQAQLRQWQQQKKGLMQQLLTGQLRVGQGR